MIIAGILSIALGATPALPVADGPPRFDVMRACRDVDGRQTGIGRPVQSCQDDERAAQSTLEARWASFPAASRTTCVEGASLGGPPSYVQVLTCLELATAPK